MIKKYSFILFSTLIWVFALFNGTGLGVAYNTNGILKVLLISIAFYMFVWQIRSNPKINRGMFLHVFMFVGVFMGISWITGVYFLAWDYIYVFLIIYIASRLKIKKTYINMVSYIYGALGFSILFIYVYGSALNNWNQNSIAMIGLFSYAFFAISFFDTEFKIRSKIRMLFFVLVSIAYINFAEQTNSRASTTMILLFVLIVFLRLKIFTDKNISKRLAWVLNIPLIMAVLVVIVSQMPIYDVLNAWSLCNFEKLIFNGRDHIWLDGLKGLKKSFLIGSGQLQSGYWHNCAISCLTTYGIIGYIVWVKFLHKILVSAKGFLKDSYVLGGVVAFCLILIQQTFELGLFAANPNMIPYLILGVLLGRIRYLKYEEKVYE